MLALTIDGTTEYLTQEQSDEAMLRYWSARQRGDQTAALKKLDFIPPANDDDDDPPPAAPGMISPIAQLRIAQQEKWLSESGFQVPPPLFAPGTRVIKLGDQNYRAERSRVDHMPKFGSASDKVINQIRAEDRRNLRVPISEITMTPKGLLQFNNQEMPLLRGAFHQIATLTGFGTGVRYLSECCDPTMRAENINYQLQRAEDREIVFRTRLDPSGQRHIFSTVTPTYAAVDSDQVLEAVSSALSDAHTEMFYDGNGVNATALWMPDQVVDLAAGDIFKVGVRVATDDTGRGRIRISGVVFRNLCLNLIIIGEGEVETVSQVHRGSPRKILSKLTEGVQAARQSVGQFLEAWGHARTVKVESKKLLKDWVEHRKLQLPGIRSAADRDRVVQSLLGAWEKEPGDTLADAINAVTRAAHEEKDWSVTFREEMERQAARLVYVRR